MESSLTMKSRHSPSRALSALLLPFGLALASASQAQQDYPTRPIRLITAAAPGGTSDILARLFAAHLTESLKQTVIVDNRASASGVIAGELTANAPPDGYTLLLAYHQHTVNAALNPKLPYHAVNSFTPITQLTSAGLMLVVNPATPVTNLKEFIDWTKSYKGALNFGSAGIGTGGHLAGELYKVMTGVKAEHIPYKGAGPALMDLVAGQYHFNFSGIQPAQVQVRAGKLRGLAVTAPKRLAALPDLPAVAEELPGFEFVGWYGIVGPAGMPKPIVTRLHDELVRVLVRPEVRERIVADGSEPVGSSPEEFRQFMLADLAKCAKLVKESGAKLD
jgi:tripartite-type tricarboxylate transporter receptor subunit TctC